MTLTQFMYDIPSSSKRYQLYSMEYAKRHQSINQTVKPISQSNQIKSNRISQAINKLFYPSNQSNQSTN